MALSMTGSAKMRAKTNPSTPATNPDSAPRRMIRISMSGGPAGQWQGKPRKCRESCTNSWIIMLWPNSEVMPWSTPTR